MNKQLSKFFFLALVTHLVGEAQLHSMDKAAQGLRYYVSYLPKELRQKIVQLSLALEVGLDYALVQSIDVKKPFTCLAWRPEGLFFAIGLPEGSTQLWSLAEGNVIQEYKVHENWVKAIAFSPDGSKILTIDDRTACLWNIQAQVKLQEFSGHTRPIRSLAFSPDGSKILTGSEDTTARLWNAATGELLKQFTGHNFYITSVAFSPDGATILTGSLDFTAHVWNVETAEVLQTFTLNTWIFSVAYSPCGGAVLIGSGAKENKAYMLNSKTKQLLRTFAEHTEAIISVGFNYDGTIAFTGSNGNPICLWDNKTGELLQKLATDTQLFDYAMFNPKEPTILTGSSNGIIGIWKKILQISPQKKHKAVELFLKRRLDALILDGLIED